jgi:DNA-binding transcriptional LysR family regulator
MNEIDLSHVDLNLLVVFDVLMSEGSVTRTAKRLGRTQSAVSHSLSRLREQLGDPLMVKSGGRMTPTPFAQRLAGDLRPILRSIQRVVAGPEPFEPATSRRLFRVTVPAATSAFMAEVMDRVRRQAPGVAVEWLDPDADAFAKVAAGLIDVAEIGGPFEITDGVEALDGPPLTWMTYARKGHPAAKCWGVEAWQRWPHIKLKIGTMAESPVERVATDGGPARTVGVWVTNISSVAPLLLRTDLLATFPPILVSEGLSNMGLCALEPPVPIAPIPMRFIWSFRLTNDPGSKWFRDIVIDVFNEQRAAGERSIRLEGTIAPQPDERKSRRRSGGAAAKGNLETSKRRPGRPTGASRK